MVLLEETNPCRTLNSTVEVFIDPEGDFTVSVHDTSEPPSVQNE